MVPALQERGAGLPEALRPIGSCGFVVIGFKSDTMRDMKDLIQFGKGIAVHSPLAVAAEDVKQKFGGIEGLLTTMIYDRQGMLRSKVVGFEYTDNIESASKPLSCCFCLIRLGFRRLRFGLGGVTKLRMQLMQCYGIFGQSRRVCSWHFNAWSARMLFSALRGNGRFHAHDFQNTFCNRGSRFDIVCCLLPRC